MRYIGLTVFMVFTALARFCWHMLSSMLIGYVAGSFKQGPDIFRRMLIAGLIAGTTGGLMVFSIFQFLTANVVTRVEIFLLTVLTRTATGTVVAIIAKVFMWCDMAIGKKPNL